MEFDPRRCNVTTSVVGLKNSHMRKHFTIKVNPRHIAENAEEEEEELILVCC